MVKEQMILYFLSKIATQIPESIVEQAEISNYLNFALEMMQQALLSEEPGVFQLPPSITGRTTYAEVFTAFFSLI